MPDDTTKKPAPEVKEPTSDAVARLRAFEDAEFGEDCVRINDQIERGSGSPFARMSDAQKAHYAALERLVEAEQKLTDANAALSVAQSNYDAALVGVEDAVKAADEAKVKADEQSAAAQAKADAKAAKQPAPV